MNADRSLVVVLTCARPAGAPDYLPETLAALDNEGALGAWQKHVICDGPALAGHFPGWRIHATESRRGTREAHWRAFWLAAALGAERLVFFEDDVQPCRNAVKWLLEVTIPNNVCAVLPHDFKEVPEGAVPGLYARPANGLYSRGMWGCQALVLPARTVYYLVGRDPRARATDRPESVDRALGIELDCSPWPHVAICAPSLADHVGEASTGTSARLHRTRNFAGRQFDATSLSFSLDDSQNLDLPCPVCYTRQAEEGRRR